MLTRAQNPAKQLTVRRRQARSGCAGCRQRRPAYEAHDSNISQPRYEPKSYQYRVGPFFLRLTEKQYSTEPFYKGLSLGRPSPVPTDPTSHAKSNLISDRRDE